MPTIQAISPAKLNLTFDIKGLMPDGYHQVETLLQSVDLQDDLVIEVSPADEFAMAITCTADNNDSAPAQFPLDKTNLIAKAARAFATEAQLDPFNVQVAVTKRIPIGAGLAGGSANAAATLVALNHVFDFPLSPAQLLLLGSQLGADVPFCIQGGTSIGTGRGDQLDHVESATTLYFCIVKPAKLSVSTPWAYHLYDEYRGLSAHQDTQAATKALQSTDLETAIRSFGNVFEPVIFEQMPQLASLKTQLIELGCWYCQLSGSGPALFAIVPDREMAHFIRRKILLDEQNGFDYYAGQASGEFSPPLEFHIAQSIDYGARVISGDAIIK